MLATQAKPLPDDPLVLEPAIVAPAGIAADADEDDFAPARGITLGVALGLVSIGVMALLGWWLF